MLTCLALICDKLSTSLSDETKERNAFIISLDETSKVVIKNEQLPGNGAAVINIEYLTRRFSELIENSFLARKLALDYTEILEQKLGKENIENNFGFISAFLTGLLAEENTKKKKSGDYLNKKP
jgi:type III restriction enzyme